MTTIGLMGFGRLGRNVFRSVYKRDDLKIGAICDSADAASLEYLLRFDTLAGRFPDAFSIKEGSLYVLGRQIALLSGYEKAAVPRWSDYGVDIVFEATARKRKRADLEAHLAAGAKRVILMSPPEDPLDLTVVMGINDDLLTTDHRIISNASATLHCLAPVVTLLYDAFGIEKLSFTSIHSYTSAHRLADVPHEDMRRGRSAPENIIPQESRSAGLLTDLLPELQGKVIGAAMNVPVAHGSAIDLVCWHEKKVTPTAINEVIRTGAASRFKAHLAYEEEPIVSSDVAQSSYSSTFDSKATMVLGERLSKTLAWCDADWGYTQRAIELVERFMALDAAKA